MTEIPLPDNYYERRGIEPHLGEPKCQHCGESITDALPGPSHTSGRNTYLNRCHPTDSGQEYGYAAHPPGTECPGHCLGAGKVVRNG
jgi:hypothetical protein